MLYRIGIDVGDTITDAVIIDEKNKIIAKNKHRNTLYFSKNIKNALSKLLEDSRVEKTNVKSVSLSTNLCNNAIVERENLCKVAILRLALPATSDIPPLANCPLDIQSFFADINYMLKGGNEYDGSEISPLDEKSIYKIANNIKGKIYSVAISGVFSHENNKHELRAAEILKEVLGNEIHVSLSHKVGGLGLLERENATILNATLNKVVTSVVDNFSDVVVNLGINAQLNIIQNNGEIISLDRAKEFPFLTMRSTLSSSILGAGAMCDLSKTIVIKIENQKVLCIIQNCYCEDSNKGILTKQSRKDSILLVFLKNTQLCRTH